MIVRSHFCFPPLVVGVVSFLQSSPCLQRFLPRVGDTVVRLTNRECHECRVHLLQHELQITHSSLHVRRNRQEFLIDELVRDFRYLFS